MKQSATTPATMMASRAMTAVCLLRRRQRFDHQIWLANTGSRLPASPTSVATCGVAGWNSPHGRYPTSSNQRILLTSPVQCGTCYGITYNGNTIYVLAIDHAGDGFNLAEAAMNELTNGQAVQLGRVDAQYSQVDVSNCGL